MIALWLGLTGLGSGLLRQLLHRGGELVDLIAGLLLCERAGPHLVGQIGRPTKLRLPRRKRRLSSLQEIMRA